MSCKKTVHFTFLLLALALPAVGEQASGAGTAPAQDAEAGEHFNARAPGVVLHVGRDVVTRYELAAALAADRRLRRLEAVRAHGTRLGKWTDANEKEYLAMKNAVTRQVLGRIVALKMLYREAADEEIKIDQEIIEKEVRRLRAVYQQAGSAAGKGRGETPKPSVEEIREQVRREYLVSVYRSKYELTARAPAPGEVREYYRKHTEEFHRPEAVRLRVIWLAELTARTPAGRALAQQLADTLIKDPSQFEETARTHSQDPMSASRGGLLQVASPSGPVEWIVRGVLPPELDAVSFALRKGEVSGVVEVRGTRIPGLFIVKVESRREEYMASFDEVREEIQRKLKVEGREKSLMKWLKRLVERVGVTDADGSKLTASYFFPDAAEND